MLKAKRPPGRRSRAASGTVRYGSANVIAPWSQNTTSKLSSRNGVRSAVAWTSGTGTSSSADRRRACHSWRAARSIPMARAPRLRRKIDHCAAPHPSSSTSLPATSPGMPRSASGRLHVPHPSSFVLSCGACFAWYSSLDRSHERRLRHSCSDRPMTPPSIHAEMERTAGKETDVPVVPDAAARRLEALARVVGAPARGGGLDGLLVTFAEGVLFGFGLEAAVNLLDEDL